MNFDFRSLPLRDLIIGGILILVIGNLIYLDIRTALLLVAQSSISPIIAQNPTTYPNLTIPTLTPLPTVAGTSPCASCPAQINMAMNLIQNIQAALTVTPKPTNTPIITFTPTPTSTISAGNSFVKEYYIPMGIGYGQPADWTDVSGVQAIIDTTLYPPIKQVTLEFTGYTPTGNQTVYARLYDDTDSHAIPGSDVTWSGGGYQSFVTGPLTLDTGNKTYSIQLKTQLQYVSYIEAARLHLVLY